MSEPRPQQDDIAVAASRIKNAVKALELKTTPVMVAKAVMMTPGLHRPCEVHHDEEGRAMVKSANGAVITIKDAIAIAVGMLETANEAMDSNARRAILASIK